MGWKGLVLGCALIMAIGGAVSAIDLGNSPLTQTAIELRYGMATNLDVQETDGEVQPQEDQLEYRPKSPVKAAVFSLLVPGLGQWYYGSRIKPFIFLGAEITAWTLYAKWHGDYNDMTAEFEAFNRSHWHESRYSEYLQAAYGVMDDDEITGYEEVSHHLPNSLTGQYYEMTGKYDQFAWGWDDATRDGNPLEHFLEEPYNNYDSLAIQDGTPAPGSANRTKYLDMRKAANDRYDRAQNMILVAALNHLISGVEAYISAKARNRDAKANGDDEFSQVTVRTSLRSLNSWQDTPFVMATYRF